MVMVVITGITVHVLDQNKRMKRRGTTKNQKISMDPKLIHLKEIIITKDIINHAKINTEVANEVVLDRRKGQQVERDKRRCTKQSSVVLG